MENVYEYKQAILVYKSNLRNSDRGERQELKCDKSRAKSMSFIYDFKKLSNNG